MVNKLARLVLTNLARPSFFSLGLPFAVSAAVATAVSLVAAFSLPAEERGQLAFVLDSSYLLAGVLLMGVPRAAIVLSKGSKARQFRLGVALVRPLVLVSTAGTAASLTAGIFWWGPPVQLLVIIFALTLSQGLAVGLQIAATTCESPHPPWAILINQAMLLGLIFALVFLDQNFGLIWAFAYVAASLPLVLQVIIHLRFRKSEKAFHDVAEELRQIRKLGLALFPLELVTVSLQRLDRLVVGIFLGLPALGVYVVVAQVFDISRSLVVYWLDTRLPGSSELDRDGHLLSFRAVTMKFTAVAVPVGALLGLLAGTLLGAIGTVIDNTVIAVITMLTFSFYTDGIWKISHHILIKSGRQAHLWKSPVAAGLTHTVFLLTLVPLVGILGAPIAKFLALTAALASDWVLTTKLRRR